jgi:hypothetical protein
MQLADQADVARRREEVDVISQAKRECQIRHGPPLVLSVNRDKLVPEIQLSAVFKIRSGGACVDSGRKGQGALRYLLTEKIARL